jgi:hypothetical protein
VTEFVRISSGSWSSSAAERKIVWLSELVGVRTALGAGRVDSRRVIDVLPICITEP